MERTALDNTGGLADCRHCRCIYDMASRPCCCTSHMDLRHHIAHLDVGCTPTHVGHLAHFLHHCCPTRLLPSAKYTAPLAQLCNVDCARMRRAHQRLRSARVARCRIRDLLHLDARSAAMADVASMARCHRARLHDRALDDFHTATRSRVLRFLRRARTFLALSHADLRALPTWVVFHSAPPRGHIALEHHSIATAVHGLARLQHTASVLR